MPLTREALVRFLADGSIEGLFVGSGESTVAQQLGSPEETTRLRGGVTLWAYEGRFLQVTLDMGRVVLMGIYPMYLHGCTLDLFGGLSSSTRPDRGTFAVELERLHIPFGASCENASALEIGSGRVIAVFSDDGKLESLQVSRAPNGSDPAPRPRDNAPARRD